MKYSRKQYNYLKAKYAHKKYKAVIKELTVNTNLPKTYKDLLIRAKIALFLNKDPRHKEKVKYSKYKIVHIRDKKVLISAIDLDILNYGHWYILKRRGKDYTYVGRRDRIRGKMYSIQLGRAILEKQFKMDKKKDICDHINGNGLDNRRENLRVVTASGNNINKKGAGKSSKYKGVSYSKHSDSWRANIWIEGRSRLIGYYKNEKQGAMAYDRVAYQFFGDLARLNFKW